MRFARKTEAPFVPHQRLLTITIVISLLGLALVWHRSLLDGAGGIQAWITNVSSPKLLATIALLAPPAAVIVTILRQVVISRAELTEASTPSAPASAAEEVRRNAATDRIAASKRRRRENRTVLVSIVLVIATGIIAGIFVFATTPDTSDRPPSRSTQSIQSAALISALSGGAITLWISNRRRRHDEETLEQSREELEQTRDSSDAQLVLSRQRAEEERFTAAIELLGHAKASVRVGALHVLHGLADTAPARRQTIVEVMSAYLRQPFLHPDWSPKEETTDQTGAIEEDREREVRRTAVRLIAALVRSQNAHLVDETPPSAEPLFVDLTGANIDEFDLSDQRVDLTAARAQFHGALNLKNSTLTGRADFSSARFHARVNMRDTRFVQAASFSRARFHERATFYDSVFSGRAFFASAEFHEIVVFRGTKFLGGIFARSTFFKTISAFNGTTFGPRSDISNAIFMRRASFVDSIFGNATFANTIFLSGASFQSAQVRDTLEFRKADFVGPATFLSMKVMSADPERGIQFEGTKFWGSFNFLHTDEQKVHFTEAQFFDEDQRPASATE